MFSDDCFADMEMRKQGDVLAKKFALGQRTACWLMAVAASPRDSRLAHALRCASKAKLGREFRERRDHLSVAGDQSATPVIQVGECTKSVTLQLEKPLRIVEGIKSPGDRDRLEGWNH